MERRILLDRALPGLALPTGSHISDFRPLVDQASGLAADERAIQFQIEVDGFAVGLPAEGGLVPTAGFPASRLPAVDGCIVLLASLVDGGQPSAGDEQRHMNMGLLANMEQRPTRRRGPVRGKLEPNLDGPRFRGDCGVQRDDDSLAPKSDSRRVALRYHLDALPHTHARRGWLQAGGVQCQFP